MERWLELANPLSFGLPSHIYSLCFCVSLQSNTIREFDTRFTSKLFGYESCEHYYKEASLHDKIHALEVPVLTLNAADDPFSPLHGMDRKTCC